MSHVIFARVSFHRDPSDFNNDPDLYQAVLGHAERAGDGAAIAAQEVVHVFQEHVLQSIGPGTRVSRGPAQHINQLHLRVQALRNTRMT